MSGGRFSYFFLQWMKFQDNSDRLFMARGDDGQSYLHFRLAKNDVLEAAAIFDTMISHWTEKEQQSRIYDYLNIEDKDGNGIWHYLADTLRENEGAATLKMARTLLSMDIDFSKRNREGVSPLTKMLLPTPRWQGLNALIQTKHLSIENIEAAVNIRAKDTVERHHLMSMIFTSDIEENKGLLSQHVLRQAVQPQADVTLRAATCRLFFEYVDIETGGTAFFKLISIANHAMFDDLIKLLINNTAETVNNMPAPDAATRKNFAQQHLARMLLRRDRRGEGVLFKAVFAGKPAHMSKITSLLHNDNLVVRIQQRGETVRQDVIVSKTSPAPSNPLLSLLLQQDVDGNTVMHHAVLRNDLQSLKLMLSGIAPNDMYAIIKSLPNRAGLTLQILTQPEVAKARLGAAAMKNLIPSVRAKEMFMALTRIDADMKGWLDARMKEIDELAASVGRKEPLPPTFQLPGMR
jgi:hypothetical protein